MLICPTPKASTPSLPTLFSRHALKLTLTSWTLGETPGTR